MLEENVPDGIRLALMLLCGDGFLDVGVEGVHTEEKRKMILLKNTMFLYSVYSCSFNSIGSIRSMKSLDNSRQKEGHCE